MKPFSKLLLYLIPVAALGLKQSFDGFTADDVAVWRTFDWIMWASVYLGSLAVPIRMFYDQSVSREESAKALEKQNNTPTPIP